MKQSGKEDTPLWVCKSLRALHGQGAWKLSRLNSTMINQYLLQILGYHVNFTRLCIMTEFSQPIRVFIVTLIYNIIPYHFVNVRKAMIAVYLQYNGMNFHKNQQLLCKNSFYNYGILHSTKLRQLRTDFYIWSTSGGKQILCFTHFCARFFLVIF